jgi:hypothetical protein
VARNESDLAAFVAASPLLSTMTTRFAETGATGRRADK